MRATFADVKTSRIPTVLGLCSTSSDLKSYVNEAIYRLIQRGKWKGSTQRFRMCVNDGCITIPRQFSSITDIAFCDEPVRIRSMFWEFLQNGQGIESSTMCGCPGAGFIDRGYFPTFNDITAGHEVRIYPTIASDIGKRVLIQGTDSNNLSVRTLDGSTYVDGVYVTITSPFAQTTFAFNSITGIQKPVSDGNILIYGVDPDDETDLIQLAALEPTELVASYRRYMISGYGSSTCSCPTTTRSLTGIAKLEFMPVVVDSDYLYIDNIPAIKEMCMSIRFGEMDSPSAEAKAILHEKNAIKELNHQMISDNPGSTIAVSMKGQGSAALSRKRIGQLQ